MFVKRLDELLSVACSCVPTLVIWFLIQHAAQELQRMLLSSGGVDGLLLILVVLHLILQKNVDTVLLDIVHLIHKEHSSSSVYIKQRVLKIRRRKERECFRST